MQTCRIRQICGCRTCLARRTWDCMERRRDPGHSPRLTRKEGERVSIHQDGTWDLLNEQRRGERTVAAMAKNNQDESDGTLQAPPPTNSEAKCHQTATWSTPPCSACAPSTYNASTSRQETYTHFQASIDHAHQSVGHAQWWTDYLRTVMTCILHFCPEDDCSRAVETVGITISLLKNNVWLVYHDSW